MILKEILVKIIGKENPIRNVLVLEGYSKDMSFVQQRIGRGQYITKKGEQ